jgi:hypothetical protein
VEEMVSIFYNALLVYILLIMMATPFIIRLFKDDSKVQQEKSANPVKTVTPEKVV